MSIAEDIGAISTDKTPAPRCCTRGRPLGQFARHRPSAGCR